jgi:hypothetical protein
VQAALIERYWQTAISAAPPRLALARGAIWSAAALAQDLVAVIGTATGSGVLTHNTAKVVASVIVEGLRVRAVRGEVCATHSHSDASGVRSVAAIGARVAECQPGMESEGEEYRRSDSQYYNHYRYCFYFHTYLIITIFTSFLFIN